MKRLLLVLALSLACKPTPTPTVINGLVDCARDNLNLVIPSILSRVTSALATGDYIEALEKLVVQYGADVVACAVQRIGGESAHDYAAAVNDTLARDRASRARAWLLAKHVEFK